MEGQTRLFPDITLEDRVRLLEQAALWKADKKRIEGIGKAAYRDGVWTGIIIGLCIGGAITIWLQTGGSSG